MYRYNAMDRRFVAERVAEFRGQVKRRLAGELSEDDFRPLRLMNGLYLQRHAYMLRICIPYGQVNSAQMRCFGRISESYDRGYGHFTTRQNLQFNWLKLEEVPDLLHDLAGVDMHAIQTSGNCVRNITTDPYAGVAPDEEVDPRPWCEYLRQVTTLHPEFCYLPRKFKIAISGATTDRAATLIHDIALRVFERDGQTFFRVAVGGGQGRTPRIAKVVHDELPAEDIVSFTEAILRVYNLHGRRDNKYKARIKILIGDLGVEAFRAQVDAEWALIREDKKLRWDVLERIRADFDCIDYADDAGDDGGAVAARQASDPAFARWLARNTRAHRQDGYRIVTLSLKKPGLPPGDLTTNQFYAVADLMERYSMGYCSVTFGQNLVFQYVADRDLPALFDALDAQGLATANIDTVADMICCPGLDFCSLANAHSIPVAQALSLALDDYERLYDIGEVFVNMSGCINACGHHHTGNIGILGINKRGESFYQIALGGTSGGANDKGAEVAEILGRAVSQDDVVPTVQKVLDCYLEQRSGADEAFYDTVKRVGITPFQESVYGAA